MSTLQPASMPGYTLPEYPFTPPPELGRDAPGEVPVAIAGAGLGGLAAALELGSRGVRVVVLDDDNTVGAAGLSSRGICYAKRTLEILERFGVADRIRAKGVTWNEGDVYRGAQRLYRFNLQPERGEKWPAFVNLQQFYVEQYMVERLQSMPAVDLRWQNRVLAVTPGADRVDLEVETPAGRYRLRAAWLVGADGAHSAVRAALGAKDAVQQLMEDIWCIADIRMSPSMEAVRKAYLDSELNEGGAIWYHQMADGVWRTDWQIAQYPDPEAETTPGKVKARLERLLGPETPFEIVWAGPWRFRKRYLERMRYGRVLFLGDAAAQHSPFGARGGNRAVQDANNLAWKLALVLEGRAPETLIDSYDAERHYAARENVEHGSRSALFIGPETAGQRLFRNAVLDLAEHHEWARGLVNTGRLSVATTYLESPLNLERGEWTAPQACPGAAAPDGELGDGGHFVERLQGRFTVAWFGAEGPAFAHPAVETGVVQVPADATGLLARYGVRGAATYVFRPDGHVLARCHGIDAVFAREAIDALLGDRPGRPAVCPVPACPPGRMTQVESDRLHDALAEFIDTTPGADRERALARLVVALAERLGDARSARAAIADALAAGNQNPA